MQGSSFHLKLPVDRPPAAEAEASCGPAGPAGQCVSTVPGEVALAIRQLAVRTKTTEFAVLLAAYAVLLSRHCQQEDLLVGVPVSTRHSGEEALVGDFVNTTALRVSVASELRFDTVVAEVQAKLLRALEHPVPWQMLVQELRRNQDLPPHLSPVIQTMFDYSGAGDFGFHKPFQQSQAQGFGRLFCQDLQSFSWEGGGSCSWCHLTALADRQEDPTTSASS